MVLIKHTLIKKIIVIISVFMVLVTFAISPVANAASSKTKMQDGEFYYAGTTQGSYVVTENIFSWLLSKLGEIVDFLLGLMTMGGRMVFVGWTALFEELITWGLEATVGIPMEIESEDGVDATATDGKIKSSNNVTIEAIVYNQVPILNINLFDNEKKNKCVTGTGQFFVECEDCYNSQQSEGDNGSSESTTETTSTGFKKAQKKLCKMDECTCEKCYKALADAGYIEKDESGNPKLDEEGNPIRTSNAVQIIKDSVSKWYYIMRLIALAAMLCVLIAVGIKMAITSVASDKAVYKRMLVDWVVGMILLFMIHYFMIFIIYFNDTFVKFIKEAETGVSDVVKKEFYIDNKSNEDIEIGIYQAVRTRAYDPKLINGTTGMILYITLVFYTLRFVAVYLKRYLNIIILTLLAPGVAFSYAIQKVMTGKTTGKAKSFSKWLNQYFVNVFVQTVHALVYTIFVSTALIISLNSISGMIVAFIFMNFMLKADGIFKKIFKMASGSGDPTNEVKNPRELMRSAKSAAGFMTAGKLLKNTPISKAVKAPLHLAKREAFSAAVKINDKINGSKETENNSSDLENIANGLMEQRKEIDPNGKATEEFEKFLATMNIEDGELKDNAIGLDGEDAIEKELAELEKIQAASGKENEKLKALRDSFDKNTNITTGDVIKAHLSELLKKDNYYEYDATKRKYVRKYGILGKIRFDRTENVWVRDSVSDIISEKLKSENLLGFTKEDKAIMKEAMGFLKGTALGMGAMFVGFGTIVSNPGIGMGFLATGLNSRIQFYEKTGALNPNRNYRPPIVDDKNKKYKFNRFGKGAKQIITQSVLDKAELEKDKVIVENVRKNHEKLYKALKLGGIGLVVAGTISAAPIALGTGVIAYRAGKGIKRYSGYSQTSLIGRMNKQHFKQYKKLREDLVKDEIKDLAITEEFEMRDTYQEMLKSLEATLLQESSKESNEEKEKLEKEALKSDNAIKFKNGEVLILDTLPEKDEKTSTASIERKIVEEAVAETMVKEILNTNTTIESFSSDSIQNSAKKKIEDKMIASGMMKENEKVEVKIKNLEKQIDITSKAILEKEFKGKELEQNSNKEISAFDKALVKEVIKEKVSSEEIKSASDISSEMILKGVEEKRKKIASKYSDSNVIGALKQEKSNIKKGSSSTQKEKSITLAEMLKMSEGKTSSIENKVIEIKRINKPTIKTESDRRAEKKRRIQALDEILKDAAKGEKVEENNSVDNSPHKTADEVIQELFNNTEDQNKVYAMLESIDTMKKLNKRGENMKMKSKNSNYNKAKKEKEKSKLYESVPELSNGDREYTNGDGVKDLSKQPETYGPVTDIVSLIDKLGK